VERLENQLKVTLSAYKRAIEAGAGASDNTEREALAKKLKERVEEAEKILEELVDL